MAEDQVEVGVSLETKGLDKGISDAEKKLGGLGKNGKPGEDIGEGLEKGIKSHVSAGAVAVGNIIANMASAAVDKIGDLFGGAMGNIDAMTKFGSTMEFGGFSQSDIDASKARVKKYADDTVYDLGTIANTTAQLAANGVQDFDGLTQAAGNLNAVAGGNAETFGSVAMVMTQTAGAGKLTTENWNQLANAIPGASGKLQEAMLKNGAYTGNFREAMEKGEITADEFNQAIMDLGMTDAAQEAAASTATFEGAMGQLEAAGESAIMGLINAVGMENITGFINAVTSGVEAAQPVLQGLGGIVSQAFGSVSGAVSGLAENVGGVSDVLAPAADAIGLFAQSVGEALASPEAQGAIESMSSSLESIGLTIGGILTDAVSGLSGIVSPMIPFVAGFVQSVIPVLASALSAVASALSFVGDVLSIVWAALQPVAEIMGGVLAEVILPAIQAQFSAVAGVLGLVGGAFSAAGSVAVSVWEAVSGWFSSLPGSIIGFFSGIGSGISSFFSDAANSAQSLWNSAVAFFMGIPGSIIGFFGGIGSGISKFFEDAGSGAKRALDDLVSDVSAIPGQIIDFFSGIPARISAFFSQIHVPSLHVEGDFNLDPANFSLPRIALYAKGGFVTRPTLAAIGEGGAQEAVIPYDRGMRPFADAVAKRLDGAGGGEAVALLAEIASLLRNMGVVLSTGELVGALAPYMDDALAFQGDLSSRGVKA